MKFKSGAQRNRLINANLPISKFFFFQLRSVNPQHQTITNHFKTDKFLQDQLNSEIIRDVYT